MNESSGTKLNSTKNEDSGDSQVTIFDGMTVLNQIKKTPEIVICKDFDAAFSKKVQLKGTRSNEIGVIFDSSIEKSMKKLLSEIQIKQHLSIYLSKL